MKLNSNIKDESQKKYPTTKTYRTKTSDLCIYEKNLPKKGVSEGVGYRQAHYMYRVFI